MNNEMAELKRKLIERKDELFKIVYGDEITEETRQAATIRYNEVLRTLNMIDGGR